MNKQFDKLLEGCPGCPLYLSDSEQQVWLAAQKAMLEVGYRKPYPAEGGLVPNPHKEYVNAECLYEDWLEDDHRKERFCEDLRHSGFQEGSQAQRAFDLATSPSLPSEDELAKRIEDSDDIDSSLHYLL